MENVKNKNTFIIACISCVALILVMLYFGINTPFKGTSAAQTCTCPTGATLYNGNVCVITSATTISGYTCDLENDQYTCYTPATCTEDEPACSKVGQTCVKGDKTGKFDENCVCVVFEDTPSTPSSPTSCASIGDATTCVNSSLNCQWDYTNGCTNKSSSPSSPTSCASIGDATTCVNSSLNCQWDYTNGCTKKSSSSSSLSCSGYGDPYSCLSHSCNWDGSKCSDKSSSSSKPSSSGTYGCYACGNSQSGQYVWGYGGPGCNLVSSTYCPTSSGGNPSGGGTPSGGGNPSGGGTPSSETPNGGNPNGGNPNGGTPNGGNPQTSGILIFIVWVIGLCTICYSFWYYKNAKNN